MQLNKASIKFFHSNKISQFQTGGVNFQILGWNCGYYCHLLSGFLSSLLIKILLMCVTSEAIGVHKL